MFYTLFYISSIIAMVIFIFLTVFTLIDFILSIDKNDEDNRYLKLPLLKKSELKNGKSYYVIYKTSNGKLGPYIRLLEWDAKYNCFKYQRYECLYEECEMVLPTIDDFSKYLITELKK